MKTQYKRCAGLLAAVIITVFLASLSSCGKSTATDAAPALGVGRVVNASQINTETETAEPQITPNGITVCVDPGHGYEDGGTSSELIGDLLEKDITLSVSMMLKEHLKAYGFEVIMTHDGTSIPKTSVDDGNNKFNPMERAAFANELGSSIDYYISLHCNSHDNSEAEGTRVYYYEGAGKATTTDLDIASTICEQIEEDFPDAPIPTCENYPYYVVKYTTVPASLIEMGFVTNPNDAAELVDEKWQDKFAESLAAALDKYYKANPKNT